MEQKTLKEIKAHNAVLEKEAERLIPHLLELYNYNEYLQTTARWVVKKNGHFKSIRRIAGDSYTLIRHHLTARTLVDFLNETIKSLNRFPSLKNRQEPNE